MSHNVTPSKRIPPELGGAIVLAAGTLALLAGTAVLSLTAGLISVLLQWLNPYLLKFVGALDAVIPDPAARIMLAVLLFGIVTASFIGLAWNAFRVAVAVYQKVAATLVRWH